MAGSTRAVRSKDMLRKSDGEMHTMMVFSPSRRKEAGNVDVDQSLGESCHDCRMLEKRRMPLRERANGVATRNCNSMASLLWESWRVNEVRRKRCPEPEEGREDVEGQEEASKDGRSQLDE